MDASLAAWVALVGGLVALLLLDLLVLHRGAREISMGNAALSAALFVAVAAAFGVGLVLIEGPTVGGEYFAGYLLELSLSLDNVFVWAVIFSAFSIPAEFQHRALFYGIFGALVLRGAFVAAGAQLLNRFDWVVYAFGALLIYSGIRMLRGQAKIDPENSRVVEFLRRSLPTTKGLEGPHLFVRRRHVEEDQRPDRKPLPGGWYATPLLAVLAVIEFSDVIFAVDSIPAIFGVTREPFIVFSATMFALVGLRQMYFLLAGARGRFTYLDRGLAVVLVFIGAKFMLESVVHIGVGVSLAVIVLVISTAVGASLLRGGDEAASS